MRANELRLGNWYDHNGTYRQATWDTIHEVWESQRSWCKPIPLTEEILLKCGFKWTDEEFKEFLEFKIFRTVKLFADYSDNFSILTFRINDSVIEIKYLHQLQNLYWCLCGEELTVNL